MRVEHDSHMFSISFKHERFPPQTVPKMGFGECHAEQAHGRTTCQIHLREGKESQIVTSAEALCSAEDQYVKETGRRLALKRAVSILPWNLRGKLLHAYFTRHQNGGGA